MIAEIIAVGTELLMGQIANTNAQFISQKLNEIGINVYFHTTVGDNKSRIKDALNLALNRSDVVVITGGLGPTEDDLTKETICEYFGLSMYMHEPSKDKLYEFFAKFIKQQSNSTEPQKIMPKSNLKQALMPEGSIILNNLKGTAPGVLIKHNSKMVALLPGPPFEMKPMFENELLPKLLEKSEYIHKSIYLKIFGIGESQLEELILDIVDSQTNPTVAPYVGNGEITLRVTARCKKEENSDTLLNPMIEKLKDRLGSLIFSVSGETLGEHVSKLLLDRKISFSFAESCTGGLLSSIVTDISGISEVFNRSFVTYSNSAKNEMLGVSLNTLEKYGAVSKETALEMARGARIKSNSQIALSVTGIAGPGGATPTKPVGLVYVGLSTPDGDEFIELLLNGDRQKIRLMTCQNAFNMIRKYLLRSNINEIH